MFYAQYYTKDNEPVIGGDGGFYIHLQTKQGARRRVLARKYVPKQAEYAAISVCTQETKYIKSVIISYVSLPGKTIAAYIKNKPIVQ